MECAYADQPAVGRSSCHRLTILRGPSLPSSSTVCITVRLPAQRIYREISTKETLLPAVRKALCGVRIFARPIRTEPRSRQ